MPVTSSSALRPRARRLIRTARVVSHVLVGAALAPTVLPLLARRRDPRRGDALVRWWMRRLLRILNVRLELEGRIHARDTLFVCNHISWLDIICLRAVLDVAFVSKDDVARWPVIGRMAAYAGTIFLARGRQDATSLTAETMTWALRQQRPILVFPEATTTDGSSVRPFFPRLYQAAIRTRGTVQAIALSYPHADGAHPTVPFLGDDDLASHLWRLLAEERISAKIVFCAPLAATGMERRVLADQTHYQVAAALGCASANVQRDVIAG
jgi:1-acyl-sn-glycerol-3-phosphate acyltransferase